MSLDYSFFYETINNIVPAKSTYTNFTLKILINNKLVKSIVSSATFAAGGGGNYLANKEIILDLSGVSLKPTNNTVDIIIETGTNLIKANAGTNEGNFPTFGTLLTMSLTDLSFLLYEK